MTDVSTENRAIARSAAAAFGGTPKVGRYSDDAGKSSVGVLECADRPVRGVSSYATIGLSDVPLIKNGRDTGIRVELVGACSNACREFANILSTAAFCVINSKWFCGPGVIFPDVVSMFQCSSTMRHVLFVPPFLWEDDLKTLTFESKTVAWLLAVPISEDEYCVAEAEGAEVLERLFEQRQIDIFDIDRPSVA